MYSQFRDFVRISKVMQIIFVMFNYLLLMLDMNYNCYLSNVIGLQEFD